MSWLGWWLLLLAVCFAGAAVAEAICTVQDSLVIALVIIGVYVAVSVCLLTWLIPS